MEKEHKQLTIAVKLVTEAFKDVVDKGNKPYINHLLKVMDNVKLDSGDTSQMIIALLHDSIEDLPNIFTIELLNKHFSKRIVNGIIAMTKIKNQTYEDYISNLILNKDAIKVKIADIKDNMDITRLNNELTEKDILRLKKYHNTYLKLINL